MKKAIILMTALLVTVFEAGVQAKPFTQGNLVIYRVGDGTSPLTNAGNYAFIDELTTNGILVQSIALPANQFIDANGNTNFPIQNSAAATSEGGMTLSTDGRYVVFCGYATNDQWKVLQSGAQLPTDTSVNRLIGTVDSKGNINTTTAFSNFINGSGGNPRCAASTDGSNLWLCGSTKGVGYVTLGGSVVTQLVGNTNKRNIGIFNPRPDFTYPPNHQQLYAMNATGILSVGTNVATVSTVESNLTGFGASVTNAVPLGSPYQFVLLNLQAGSTNVDTMYIADEGSNVSKWCYNQISTTWSNVGSINTVSGPNGISIPCGVRGITASVFVSGSQTNVDLFLAAGCGGSGTGVVPGGFLYHVRDSSGYGGSLSGQLPMPLATTANLFASTPLMEWRGVAFAPADTFQVKSIAKSGNDVPVTWNAMGGRNYIVQSTPGDASGNYSNNFVNIGPTNWALGFGLTQASYTDVGGATNKPSRYYRIQLVPDP